jgi:hypothetical protein
MANYNKELRKSHDIHESEVEPRLDERIIYITARTGVKSVRKIPILDVVSRGEDTVKDFKFACCTVNLEDIYSKCDGLDEIEIWYTEDSKKPIMVVGPEILSEKLSDLKVQTRIIFGTLAL